MYNTIVLYCTLYCSAAEMPWPTTLFSPDRNPVFGTDDDKCHIMILIVFFSENESCDAKMTIPTNGESYHNHNMIIILIFSPNGEL